METEEAPTDAAAPPPNSNDTDVNMQDAKATADAPGVENGVPEAADKPVQMDTDTKVGLCDCNSQVHLYMKNLNFLSFLAVT